MELNVGDIVARKSYDRDIYFKIDEITVTEDGERKAKLKGLDVRLLADSPLEDLIRVENELIGQYRKKFIKQNNKCLERIMVRRSRDIPSDLTRNDVKPDQDFFDMPGRVLHIDGTPDYLKLCMAIYDQLGISAKGFHISEKNQAASVPELLKKYRPDILVLTGHDGIIKETDKFRDLSNYHNSKYFVEAVSAARDVENNKDNLIIFAGACQSHYEEIIRSGANFASSPMRVFIHAFDPVFIVEKIAFTTINETIVVNEAIDSTITGTDGLGGIDTRGKLRRGFPRSPY